MKVPLLTLSNIWCVNVLEFGHSYRFVVASHYCFNVHFPDDM